MPNAAKPPLSGDAGAAVYRALVDAVGQDNASAYAMELAGAEEYDVFLLAVAHLMNRQLETAAWLFWQDALRRPGDAMTLSRLGLVLHEMYVYTGATDPALLDGAIAALRGAAEAAPAEASVLNNLAYALSRRGRPEDLSEAAWLIKRAVELDPEEPLYWVRRALVAQAPDEPDKALESVFVAHAMSPVVTAALDPSRIDGFVEADKPYCEIVCLACDSCPPGIIGELNRITCLMEEQGARLACQAGELFPTSFDCFEGLPDYGILIPGLNAGLSILTPFGELHVSIDGDGVVHWKAGVKFPAGRLEPGAGAAGTRHVGSDRRGHGDPDGPVRQGHRARRQRPGQVPNHRQVRGVGAQRQPVRREAGVGIPRRRPAARGHGVCRDRQHNGVDGALMSGPGAVRTAGTVVGGLRARSWAHTGGVPRPGHRRRDAMDGDKKANRRHVWRQIRFLSPWVAGSI